jgi:hypothetical protein
MSMWRLLIGLLFSLTVNAAGDDIILSPRPAAAQSVNSTDTARQLPQGDAGIAARFPGDQGIDTHPAVVFVEGFEQETLEALWERWDQVRSGESMSFSAETPPGSRGRQALRMDRETGSGPSLYRRVLNPIDGRLVSHLGHGFPKGAWVWDKFQPGQGGPSVRWGAGGREDYQVPEGGAPFEGFRWRTVPELDVNFIWLYAYTEKPAGHRIRVEFDDVVVATEYIGPLKQ